MIFSVRLPVPPSANNLFLNAAGRGRVLAPEYRKWKRIAAPILEEAWLDCGKPTIPKPYRVRFLFGINRRGDIFNREKALMDLLVKHCDGFPDDRWIDHGIVRRWPSIMGECIAEIYDLGEIRA